MIIHGQAQNQQNSPDAEKHDDSDQGIVIGLEMVAVVIEEESVALDD
jgi:hypothetical protein